MSLTVKNSGGDFEKAPIGNHVAICYMVIDMGDQTVSWKGDTKNVHQIRIGWELCNEQMADGRPFAVFKTYTASLSEKANLRKDLQSWRGRPFTEQELAGFDLFNVVGVPCMLNVIHQTNENNGNVYANIASISPLVKGMARPELRNAPVKFSLEKFDAQVYDSLPDWLKEKINVKGVSQQPAPQLTNNFPDDEIPF